MKHIFSTTLIILVSFFSHQLQAGKVQEAPKPLKISVCEKVVLDGTDYVKCILPDSDLSVLMKKDDELPGSFSLVEINDETAVIFSYRLNLRRSIDVFTKFKLKKTAAEDINAMTSGYIALFHDYEVSFKGTGKEFTDRLKEHYPGEVFVSPSIMNTEVSLLGFEGCFLNLLIQVCEEKNWGYRFYEGDLLIWNRNSSIK